MNQLPQDKIEGRNPVLEALKSERQIDKIFVQRDIFDTSVQKIRKAAKEKKILVKEVDRAKLDFMSETKAHQGVIACVAMHEYVEVEDILKAAQDKGEPPFVVICDGISDPHNLGAIIRTANCAGAHGVIIKKHHSVGLSAVVSKASAGAIEYVPVAKVTNITNTLRDLKEAGLWIVGADMMGDTVYYQSDLKGSIGLVVGNEGDGISDLVKKNCDFLVNIPMKGQINSLNVSVAAAIMMYEIAKQRGESK